LFVLSWRPNFAIVCLPHCHHWQQEHVTRLVVLKAWNVKPCYSFKFCGNSWALLCKHKLCNEVLNLKIQYIINNININLCYSFEMQLDRASPYEFGFPGSFCGVAFFHTVFLFVEIRQLLYSSSFVVVNILQIMKL
jgi:hypothetical protein